jgi:hypothetical protein
MKHRLVLLAVVVACTFAALPSQSGAQSQTLQCESDTYGRKYCAADTRGGVRLTRQISGAACTQGSSWGYDERGVWVSNGCRAEFEVLPVGLGSRSAQAQTVRCEAEGYGRKYCAVEPGGVVRLVRQISGADCTRDSSWGYDSRGIWVSNGCRADFEVLTAGSRPGSPQSVRCEAEGYGRKYCAVDTSGGVRLVRQLGGADCTQGSTWGYDNGGIWVRSGCRADFEVLTAGSGATTAAQSIRCEAEGYGRKYCAADTSGGVRLVRQISGAACTQDSSWGYDSGGVWVSNGCRADFEVMSPGYRRNRVAENVRCEATNVGQRRTYCPADTSGGVRLTRQIGRASCVRDSTWGFNERGIWVSRGCRGDFAVLRAETGYGVSPDLTAQNLPQQDVASQILRCESLQSTGYGRKYCPADTRGGVRLTRQIGSTQCTQGSTWGYDDRGVWVDQGCRAEFELTNSRYPGGRGYTGPVYTTIPAGTELTVRTNDPIDSKIANEGQRYSAVVAADVRDSSGAVVIPKGSDAELVIRTVNGGGITSGSDLILDVETVTVAGRRYAVSTGDLEQKGTEGIGANRRTATMVGGGALLGTLIGAIAGGGKGAAIGAAVGAAAGAGGVILTKGKEVRVPSETVLTFRLDQDVRLRATQ